MEEGLLKNTGKSLEEWKKIVGATKLDKYKDIMTFLKKDQGVTHGFSNFITLKFLGTDAGSHDDSDLLANQYKGKEILKPIYEKLIAEIEKFGNDITQTPKKDSVSIIRKNQFALIKPATKTRVDLGLKLKGKPNEGRLEGSGPFGAMCTHRVQLTKEKQVDAEVLGWLKEAYEMSV